MDIAIIGTSRKEHEKRVPIHPVQIQSIPKDIRGHLFFEKGYGQPFGMGDDRIAFLTGNRPLERAALLREKPAFLLPKPVLEDLEEMPDGAVVWGWIHAVQQKDVTQIAVAKKMTLVAWEHMYHRSTRGRVHVFEKNNEMAGYCGVQHALQLMGIDGCYGMPRRAVIIGFGSVSRGAVYSLLGHGFRDITVLTRRPSHLVSNRIPGLCYRQFGKTKSGEFRVKEPDGRTEPLVDVLAQADVLVNGVLQNPNHPDIFVRGTDLEKFTKECLVVDISCDRGMSFSFARPTTLENPVFRIGNIAYYSLDHTPTLLWNSASWEISSALLPYLKDFVNEKNNRVLQDAVDIQNGVILNKDILEFQNRVPESLLCS